MDDDVLYNENCKKAAKIIKMREKWKRNADRHYLRHRETVLEKHRYAASAASGQKDTVDDSIQFSTDNGTVTFD